MTERIVSTCGLKSLHLSELFSYFKQLGIESFDQNNQHHRNYSRNIAQMSPLVLDPIISFSPKSLVLALNKDQICKIRLDNNFDLEYMNHTTIINKSNLFPRLDGFFEFENGVRGIIMERLKVFEKLNFTSGQLNGMFYCFFDELKKLHDSGIIHRDLGYAKESKIRPNIILTESSIRLIDCETILFNEGDLDWKKKLLIEQHQINELFLELIDFRCETLT
jgi:serine/threonine protein kinase